MTCALPSGYGCDPPVRKDHGSKFLVEQSKSYSIQYFNEPLIVAGFHGLDVLMSQEFPKKIGKLKEVLWRAWVTTLTCIKQAFAERKIPSLDVRLNGLNILYVLGPADSSTQPCDL